MFADSPTATARLRSTRSPGSRPLRTVDQGECGDRTISLSTLSNFKAIPGALMEYTITLANNGGAVADTRAETADALPTQDRVLGQCVQRQLVMSIISGGALQHVLHR